jgi:hypothetical protein
MRRSYVVPMSWMVIYEYEVPGGALNLSSAKLPRPWSPWGKIPMAEPGIFFYFGSMSLYTSTFYVTYEYHFLPLLYYC